jgi:hypothetical protein
MRKVKAVLRTLMTKDEIGLRHLSLDEIAAVAGGALAVKSGCRNPFPPPPPPPFPPIKTGSLL